MSTWGDDARKNLGTLGKKIKAGLVTGTDLVCWATAGVIYAIEKPIAVYVDPLRHGLAKDYPKISSRLSTIANKKLCGRVRIGTLGRLGFSVGFGMALGTGLGVLAGPGSLLVGAGYIVGVLMGNGFTGGGSGFVRAIEAEYSVDVKKYRWLRPLRGGHGSDQPTATGPAAPDASSPPAQDKLASMTRGFVAPQAAGPDGNVAARQRKDVAAAPARMEQQKSTSGAGVDL